MPDDRDRQPKRPPTFTGESRDRRHRDTSGVVAQHIDEEHTPPPQPRPVIAIGRAPSPEEVRLKLAAVDAQLEEHREALGRVWGARDVDKRIDRLEAELRDNTRSTVRMEAVLGEMVVPHVKEQMAKLDTCLHHIAASSHLTASVVALGEKLDALGASMSGIKTEQATAAERFEAHDQRDREIERVVHRIDTRVTALEHAQSVADTTAKVKKLVAAPRWWRATWVKAIGLAVAGAITAATAYYFGG